MLRPGSALRVASARARSMNSQGDWPLTVSANGRYMTKPDGTPFFSIIDTAWCAIPQLSTSQMDTYVADCVSRKINGIIVQLMDNTFIDNPPNTFDGIPPLTTQNNFSTPNEAYFARADYLVNACKNAGINVWMWPLYVGLQPGGSQGWSSQFEANTQAARQAWGTFIANRYKNYGNIVWVHGGDGTVSNFGPYNDYIERIVTIWPESRHSYHAARTDSAYEAANGQSWLSVNNVYSDDVQQAALALTEWNRTPVRPVFFVEGIYEVRNNNSSGVIAQLWQALCSGCLGGVAYGNRDIWTFGGPGYDQDFASHYSDEGRAALQHIRTLVDMYQWWLLEPRTDTSLVTTSLGSGVSQICPMIASNLTFAWIFSPGANFTLNRAAFSGAHANIRIRSYAVMTGTFSTISASVPTTGTQAITVSGNQVIVVDGAP